MTKSVQSITCPCCEPCSTCHDTHVVSGEVLVVSVADKELFNKLTTAYWEARWMRSSELQKLLPWYKNWNLSMPVVGALWGVIIWYLGISKILPRISTEKEMWIFLAWTTGPVLVGSIILMKKRNDWQKAVKRLAVERAKKALQDLISHYDQKLLVDQVSLNYGEEGMVYIAGEDEVIKPQNT